MNNIDDNEYDDEYEGDDEKSNNSFHSEEPLGFCFWCEAPIYTPEELETRFCEGGTCEENYHNHIEFE